MAHLTIGGTSQSVASRRMTSALCLPQLHIRMSNLTPAPRARTSLSSELLVASLLLAWFAATAWARPLLLPDEGRYVGVAWEMLRSGHWLVPTLDGLPFFHKPPLFYWLTSAALSVGGLNVWAARASAILAATCATFACYRFVTRWQGARSARLATVALAAQTFWYLGAQFANMDMLVAGCITVTIVLLAHAALSLEAGGRFRSALIGAWLAAGLGVLAKGLIGFVLPAMVVGLWLIALGRWRTMLRLLSLPGIVLMLGVCAPWFIAVDRQFPGFMHYFFVTQHFDRFAKSGFNNVQPVWFYPVVILVFSLPWWPWLLRSLRLAPAAAPDKAIRLLLLIWVVAIVGFFSIPRSKPLGYVLPAVPPMALLAAMGFELAERAGRSRAGAWALSVTLSVVLGLGAIAVFSLHPAHSTRELALALASARRPGEPVVMLYQYDYDVPFYARLSHPVHVVEEWSSERIRQGDSWNKELSDAGDFDPALARKLLITPSQLTAVLCSSPRSWVLGTDAHAAQFPFLAHAAVLTSARGQHLWRVEAGSGDQARALGCASAASGAP